MHGRLVCSKSDSLSEVEFIHGRLVWSKPDFPQRVWGYTDGWFGLNLIFLRERVRLVTDSLSETSPTDAGVSPRSPNMGMRHSRNSPCTPFFCWVLLGDRLTNRGHVRWEVSSASLPLVAWQPLLLRNSKVANLFSPVLFIHHSTKQNCNHLITTAAVPQ